MPRKIVLCLDGTNNEYAAVNTNVVKLYAMLDRAQDDQLGYYQPGIGTFAPPGVWEKPRKWIITRLDLAVAWLLEEHVTDAYRFLMQYYQPGDEIFIFGFSRGSYSARALAAMLYKVGLLSPGNEEMLSFAWDTFKREKDRDVYIGFRHTFCRKVTVRFLGLWDTVSSVGWAWHPQYLQFTENNPAIGIVRHAMALDERRAYFVQNLCTHTPPASQDVQQVWFPGVHCDVGGGYKESEAGLSKIALAWMVGHAEGVGLRFNPAAKMAILPPQDTPQFAAPNAAAKKHESLHGLWWLVEYIPKRIHDPSRAFAPRWILHGGRHRYVAENSNIHRAVFDRMECVPDYRPPNLPRQYVKVL
jgi:uncharacterized protein (DUF2235 family)